MFAEIQQTYNEGALTCCAHSYSGIRVELKDKQLSFFKVLHVLYLTCVHEVTTSLSLKTTINLFKTWRRLGRLLLIMPRTHHFPSGLMASADFCQNVYRVNKENIRINDDNMDDFVAKHWPKTQKHTD